MRANEGRRRRRRRQSHTHTHTHTHTHNNSHSSVDTVADDGQEERVKLRKTWYPTRPVDMLCFYILLICLPCVTFWDVLVVLPNVHEPLSFWHVITLSAAIFITLNITGNLAFCITVDTSINSKAYERPPQELLGGWRYCETCEKHAPPRSWHCKSCKTCILKRDHHCVFTACCIGHNNQRYFVLFVLYMYIGSMLSFAYNTHYLFYVKSDEFYNFETALLICCPTWLLNDLLNVWHDLHIVVYILNILAILMSSSILLCQLPFVIFNGKCFACETRHYSLGLKQNFECVFGKRMHLALLWPFVESELPYDGIYWEPSTLCRQASYEEMEEY